MTPTSTPHDPRPTAILLAAGSGARMEQSKPLLDWHGEPLVRHMARTALAAQFAEVVVVTGHAGDAVARALHALPVRVVHNPRHAEGMSTSLIAGFQALAATSQAAAVLLVDQPLITTALLDLVLAAAAEHPDQVVAPVWNGQRGNPIVFPRRFWELIWALSGDQGARRAVATLGAALHLVPVDTDAVVRDADTPEQYAGLVGMSPGASM